MRHNHDTYHISVGNQNIAWQDIVGDATKNMTLAKILRDILKKVDKEEGKCLIPVSELARIRTLYNYDDKLIKAQIKTIQQFLDTLDLDGLREQIYSLEMALFDIQQELEARKQESSKLHAALETVAHIEDIPRNISQLVNDAEYVKPAQCEDIFDVKITELNPLLFDEL